MKVRHLLLLLFALFIFSSCQRSAAVDSVFLEDAANANDNKSEKSTSDVVSNSDKSVNLTDIKSNQSLLWNAAISYSDLIDTKNEVGLYSYDENQYENPTDKNSPYFKARNGIAVDLMNCGGYLASGRLYASEDSDDLVPDWRLKIAPDTIAKDAEAKIKRCDENNYEGTNNAKKEVSLSAAFAVASTNKSRRKITIGDTDTRKLFASLPKDIKERANSKVNTNLWKRKKDNLTLLHDNWTDLDGDGEIDLVIVELFTDEEHGTETILRLVNGKWQKIATVQPA